MAEQRKIFEQELEALAAAEWHVEPDPETDKYIYVVIEAEQILADANKPKGIIEQAIGQRAVDIVHHHGMALAVTGALAVMAGIEVGTIFRHRA